MSVSFKQWKNSRVLSQPLQPKIINANGYFQENTDYSDRLVSNEISLEEDITNDISNITYQFSKPLFLGIPNEYNEDEIENEEIGEPDEDFSNENTIGSSFGSYKSAMIDQKFQEFMQQNYNQSSYDGLMINNNFYYVSTVNIDHQNYKRPFHNNINKNYDYGIDKQRKLQELYQANEIIYEEEDSPERLSTGRSVLSRQPNTLSNQEIQSFQQDNNKSFDEHKEHLIDQIDKIFKKKYEQDILTLRDRIQVLQHKVSTKQSFLQQLVSQNQDKQITKPKEQVSRTKFFHKHSRSFNSCLSQTSISSNHNSTKTITTNASQTKYSTDNGSSSHIAKVQKYKETRANRQQKLFKSDIITNNNNTLKINKGLLSPQNNSSLMKKSIEIFQFTENKENQNKSRQKRLLNNSKSSENHSRQKIQEKVQKTMSTKQLVKKIPSQISTNIFSMKQQNHKLRLI